MQPAADGSPQGSTQGQGGTAVDGAELARRMMMATEAASAATEMAARALEELKTASERSSENRDWYKLLAKPASFDPSSREAEIAGWKDWSWALEQYLGSLDAVFTEEIRVIRNNSGTVVDTTAQSNAEMRRGSFLYGLLASLLKQRPLMVLKAVGEANGYEAYRQLICANEPHSKNRSMSLLNLIMNWPSFSGKGSLLSQIMKLENAYSEYERLGTPLAEEIRSAVLMRCITGQLKVWLQLQITEATTYNQLRELVISYERSTSRWTESMVLGGDAVESSSPMEVDRVQDGKGKSKSDFKGKGGKHKNGKGKDVKGKNKTKDGKQNYYQKSSGKSWFSASKGKDSGLGKGKGHGGKQSTTGNGKGQLTIKCWTCGGNHKQQNCWKNQHVRQVADDGSRNQDDSSHGPQPSQQSQSIPASSSQAPSSSNSHAAPSAPTTYRVNRIACTPNNSGEFEFDLGALGDFGKLSIRAVHEMQSRCHVRCEQFFIGSDDDDSVAECIHPIQDISQLYDFDWSSVNVDCCDLSIYERIARSHQCLRDDRPWRPSGVTNMFSGCDENSGKRYVRAIRDDDQITEFLIDSGSDATVVPMHFSHCGRHLTGESNLIDCQGNALNTAGLREFRFVMQTVDGRTICFKEIGHLSSSVSHPLVSFGRLFKAGWRINGDGMNPLLEHVEANLTVAMTFKNESFIVQGYIRRLEQVNAVRVGIPAEWLSLELGWHRTASGLPLCRSNGTKYIDARKRFSLKDYPRRTTFCLRPTGWELVERCARYAVKDQHSHSEPLAATGAITILSPEWIDIEELGVVQHVTSQSSSSQRGQLRQSAPVRPRVDESMPSIPVRPDVTGPDVGQQVRPNDVEMVEAGSQPPESGSTPDARAEVAQRSPGVEVGIQAENPQGNPDLPDAGAQQVALRIVRDSIDVNGVHITIESTAATLRTACKYLSLSSSGGKSKMFNRIIDYYDRQQLSLAQEVQASLQHGVVAPRQQPLVEKPSDDEVREHQLTHIPYQPWCEACVQGKARPDSHVGTPEQRAERSITRVSFDLSFTGKEYRESGGPKLVDADELWKEKIIVLNCHDSSSGNVAAIPVRRKGDIHYMAREASKFAAGLGVGELELHCDNEPTMLQVLSLLQRTLLKMGIRVITSTSKPRAHGGNANAEQTVHRVRQNAMVLIAQIELNLMHAVPINHPISTWAFKHAAWIINRFISRAGHTPFFMTHGHDYAGKRCPFGEVIMAYVADDRRQKGSARWAPMIFLGKTENDMYIVGCDRCLRVTRSIKRIYTDMQQHLGLYQQLQVMSWMIEGTLGTRLRPGMPRVPAPRGVAIGGEDIPDSDEEALAVLGHTDDVSDDDQDISGIDITVQGLPMAAMVPSAVLQEQQSGAGVVPVSSETPAIPGGVSDEVEMCDTALQHQQTESADVTEPSAKRQKLSVSRVCNEVMFHVDDTEFGQINDIDLTCYNDFDEQPTWTGDEYDEGGDLVEDPEQHELWFPYSVDEPAVYGDTLQHLDRLADEVEIARLKEMHVLEPEDAQQHLGQLGSDLTAKFVRTWRRKERDGQEQWLGRSRLVAREFNRMELRDDLFSPASNHVVERLLPALAVSQVFGETFVLGALDIGDAYLQVPQANRRRVRILDYPSEVQLLICRCLPGQRDGSRRWFDFFSEFLVKELDLKPCAEQPAMFKIPACDGGGVLLVHVDDVLFLADESYVRSKMIPKLKSAFKLSMTLAPRTGGSFSFLKREHVVEQNYESITIVSENKHIKQAFQQYCKFGTTPKLHKTPGIAHAFAGHDTTDELDNNKASAFRSILGALLYISHERADIQYSTKSLASYLKSPTTHSWLQLGRLLGYLKFTEAFSLFLSKSSPGTSLFEKLNGVVEVSDSRAHTLVETFTDSDWQGSRDLKSTSAACHFVNGNLVHSSSRTQHVISLSSTESEFYASTSASIDTIYLKNILSFLLESEVNAKLHTDNSASKQIACKLGTSRLRHISGRLLWMQSKVREGVFKIIQVGTAWNPSDIGTKLLSRDRHLMILFMLGFVCDGERIGEDQFLKQKQIEFSRRSIKMIKGMYGSSSGSQVAEGSAMSSSFNSNLAKRILQVSILNVAGALGQAAVEPNTDETRSFAGYGFWILSFVCILVCIMASMFFMMGGDQTIRSEGFNRDRQLFLCYRFLGDAFARLRHLMSRDHQQLGRGFAVLHHLIEILQDFESNTDLVENCNFLSTMRHSISEMELGTQYRTPDIPALTNGDLSAEWYEQQMRGMPLFEPEPEIPSIADNSMPMFLGELPAAGEPHSPEHMAQWMRDRLTRRVVSSCVANRSNMGRYYHMRRIMDDEIESCGRSEYNRRRAVHMLTTMDDLSDHDSSDDENFDPWSEFTAFIPDTSNLMSAEETLLGVDGSDEYHARTIGDMGLDGRGPETSASIPAYVVIDGFTYYTANLEDVHESATMVMRDGDWNYYEFQGTRFRVRTWETRQELEFRVTTERLVESGDIDPSFAE